MYLQRFFISILCNTGDNRSADLYIPNPSTTPAVPTRGPAEQLLTSYYVYHRRGMSALPELEVIRGVMVSDDKSDIGMMMEKYAKFNGVHYDTDSGELITAFNGRKCVFKAISMNHCGRGFEDPHVFLVCLSVVRQANAEETLRLILNTVADKVRGVPFVLVGTQIHNRLSILIENYDSGGVKYLPMPLEKAEKYAKRIGAAKYIECSEVTGEGVDEVFEEAFDIGYSYAVEQLRGYRRKISAASAAQTTKERKLSCITQ